MPLRACQKQFCSFVGRTPLQSDEIEGILFFPLGLWLWISIQQLNSNCLPLEMWCGKNKRCTFFLHPQEVEGCARGGRSVSRLSNKFSTTKLDTTGESVCSLPCSLNNVVWLLWILAQFITKSNSRKVSVWKLLSIQITFLRTNSSYLLIKKSFEVNQCSSKFFAKYCLIFQPILQRPFFVILSCIAAVRKFLCCAKDCLFLPQNCCCHFTLSRKLLKSVWLWYCWFSDRRILFCLFWCFLDLCCSRS